MVVEDEIDLAGDDLRERLLHRFVWHMDNARAGHLLEELAAQMQRRPIARRSECELVGIRSRVVDEVSHGLDGQRVAHSEQILPGRESSNDLDLAIDVIRQVRHERREDREVNHVGVAERVAIGWRASEHSDADHSAGGGTIVDDELRFHLISEFGG